MKIILVEDNKKLSGLIKDYLVSDGFLVDQSFDGEDGLKNIRHNTYDCVILDINMPKINGFEVCKKLREEGNNTPILFLTALTDKRSTVKGLNIGADDYLGKPFDLEELVARVKSLLRRTKGNTNTTLKHDDILINTKAMEVFKKGKRVSLAPVEYQLLRFLLLNKGTVIKRGDLIENVWNDYDRLMFSRTVDVHVASLRKKVGKDFIKTVKGVGYIIN